MSKARDLANASTALSAVTATELGYVDGVTSAIQTQIDSKIGSASAINPTIVDAKGDIIAATAADTVARLAVGANGTVLTAASGQATGLEWATPSSGGITLLSTTSLSGASTTISSINQTYTNLVIVVSNVYSTGADQFFIKPNGTNSIGLSLLLAGASTADGVTYANITSPNIGTSTSATPSALYLNISNYADTTSSKPFSWYGNVTAAQSGLFMAAGAVVTNTAISSLVFSIASGTFAAGTVKIYGVK